jgi:hypothetical protein
MGGHPLLELDEELLEELDDEELLELLELDEELLELLELDEELLLELEEELLEELDDEELLELLEELDDELLDEELDDEELLEDDEETCTPEQAHPFASIPNMVLPGTASRRLHSSFPLMMTPSERASHGSGPLSRVYTLAPTGSNP